MVAEIVLHVAGGENSFNKSRKNMKFVSSLLFIEHTVLNTKDALSKDTRHCRL